MSDRLQEMARECAEKIERLAVNGAEFDSFMARSIIEDFGRRASWRGGAIAQGDR